MKTTAFALSAVGACLAVLLALPAFGDPNSPVGRWQTVDDKTGKVKAVVEVWKENSMLYGKIAELLDPDAATVCDKCSGELKGRPMVACESCGI